MTTVMDELIDWALLEDLKDDRPCYDCGEKAAWLQTFTCCGFAVPKCDLHKKMQEAKVMCVEKCTTVAWNCLECGARGMAKPGIKIWDCVRWEPL